MSLRARRRRARQSSQVSDGLLRRCAPRNDTLKMRITEMHITPIVLGDPPLLNAAGLHAPWCLRTVVELVADNGLSGLAEVPGSVAVTAALEASREIAVGADPLNWHALRAALAARF